MPDFSPPTSAIPSAQSVDRADTVTRKLREARSAIEIDKNLGKDEILTDYLNVVEFTGKVYGVEAAARAYFGTTAAQLTVPQAALLAGMINNPTTYNPFTHPADAQRRRDLVIDAMLANHAIDQQTAAQEKSAPLGVSGPNVPASTCFSAQPDAGFFRQYALSYLRSAGVSAEQLTNGGYTIRTTMDSRVSAAAKQAMTATRRGARPLATW